MKWFLFFLGLIGLIMHSGWVTVNVSASIPLGLYRLRAVPAALPRGHVVQLPGTIPQAVAPAWPGWLRELKPVAGVAGDTVCRQPAGGAAHRLLVAGRDYGPWEASAALVRPSGAPLPAFPAEAGCLVVPPGMVFLASGAPKSLDSRYYGLVRVDHLLAVATPLVTW